LAPKQITASPCEGADFEWNSSKFLVGRDGKTVVRLPKSAYCDKIETELKKLL
jgi:glutathione peroxidase-family protein